MCGGEGDGAVPGGPEGGGVRVGDVEGGRFAADLGGRALLALIKVTASTRVEGWKTGGGGERGYPVADPKTLSANP